MTKADKIILSIIFCCITFLYLASASQKANEKIEAPQLPKVVSTLSKCEEEQDVKLWSNCQGNRVYINGDKSSGEFIKGKLTGQGIYTWVNGDQYRGQFEDGIPSGRGSLIYVMGDRYVGDIKDGKLHGRGTYTFVNGSQYVGEYKDGLRSGQGEMTWPSGRKYSGEWKKDIRVGSGRFAFLNGKEVIGKWVNKYFKAEDRKFNIYSKTSARGYYKTAKNWFPFLDNTTKHPFRNDKNVFGDIFEKDFEDFYNSGAYSEEFYRFWKIPPSIQRLTFEGLSRKEGVFEFTSRNGSRKRIETWKKGKLVSTVNFVNGELNGLYDMYNETGQLVTRITFKDGLKHGNTYQFFPDGRIKTTKLFKRGGLLSEIKSNKERE